MNYAVTAHPTKYAGVQFRSRLEARWAAFFDLMRWPWEYEPIDLAGWVPDFLLFLPCFRDGCPPWHKLYVEVKPYMELAEFADHPVAKLDPYSVPSPAKFGLSPDCTSWHLTESDGRGSWSVLDYGPEPSWAVIDERWREAGNRVQWRAPKAEANGCVSIVDGWPTLTPRMRGR